MTVQDNDVHEHLVPLSTNIIDDTENNESKKTQASLEHFLLSLESTVNAVSLPTSYPSSNEPHSYIQQESSPDENQTTHTDAQSNPNLNLETNANEDFPIVDDTELNNESLNDPRSTNDSELIKSTENLNVNSNTNDTLNDQERASTAAEASSFEQDNELLNNSINPASETHELNIISHAVDNNTQDESSTSGHQDAMVESRGEEEDDDDDDDDDDEDETEGGGGGGDGDHSDIATDLNKNGNDTTFANCRSEDDFLKRTLISLCPVLDILATNILSVLGRGSHAQTLEVVTKPDTLAGHTFATLRDLFLHTRRSFSNDPFLNSDQFDFFEDKEKLAIRKANLVTFITSLFGSDEVGFFHLNENFLITFLPEGAKMLKAHGKLFLDLKTQAYISAVSTGERSKEEILDDLFPDNLGEVLKQYRNTAKLNRVEQELVDRCVFRKDYLKNFDEDVSLYAKYPWSDFLHHISEYITRNHENISYQLRRGRKRRNAHLRHRRMTASRELDGSSPMFPEKRRNRVGRPPNAIAHERATSSKVAEELKSTEMQVDDDMSLNVDNLVDNPPNSEAETTTTTTNNANNNNNNPERNTEENDSTDLNNTATQSASEFSTADGLDAMDSDTLANSPSGPSTADLYIQARRNQGSQNETDNLKRSKLSNRRPWTKEEEAALFEGIDIVKGPHWSEILRLYGAGGTKSEVLKNRSQIQLKDKARNLKLFFLKNQLEVPPNLKSCTGDLRKELMGG